MKANDNNIDILEKAEKDKAEIFLEKGFGIIRSGKNKISAASGYIDNNEIIKIVVVGDITNYDGRTTPTSRRKGTLIVTDKKIILATKKDFGFENDVTTIQGRTIMGVQSNKKLMSAGVKVDTNSISFDISNIQKEAQMPLINAVHFLIENANKVVVSSQSTNNVSIVDELTKAKTLLESKVITQEEFDELKAKLLK